MAFSSKPRAQKNKRKKRGRLAAVRLHIKARRVYCCKRYYVCTVRACAYCGAWGIGTAKSYCARPSCHSYTSFHWQRLRAMSAGRPPIRARREGKRQGWMHGNMMGLSKARIGFWHLAMHDCLPCSLAPGSPPMANNVTLM